MVLLATSTRNTAVDAVAALANGGSLEIGTTSMASVLVIFTLANPALSAAVSGSASGASLPIAATAAATGTAAAYRVKNSGGTVIWSGTSVTASGGGGEVTLTSVSITSGQSVSLTSLTVSQPAS